MVPSFKDPAWLDFQADFIIELHTFKKKTFFTHSLLKQTLKKIKFKKLLFENLKIKKKKKSKQYYCNYKY